MRKIVTVLSLFLFGTAITSLAQNHFYERGTESHTSQKPGANSCPSNIEVNNDAGVCGAMVNYMTPTQMETGYFNQANANSPMTVVVRCVLSNLENTAAGYLRVYDLPAMGIKYGFTLSSFEFGIRQTRTLVDPSQPVTLNVYSWDKNTALSLANFSLEASITLQLVNQTRTIINQPLVASIPAGKAMVMEVAVPDATGKDYRFIMGATDQGETAPSYSWSQCTNNIIIKHADQPFSTPNEAYLISAYGSFAKDAMQVAGLPSGAVFPVGTTTNTFSIEEDGVTSNCSFQVKVKDTEAPVIQNASASPSVLWPANHKMVPVTINYSSSDNCIGESCEIYKITSNEHPLAPGSGNTAIDWQIVNNHQVLLRAERAGGGNGREYTIWIRCTDASGNKTEKSVTVYVPKSAADLKVNQQADKKQQAERPLIVMPNPTTNFVQVKLPETDVFTQLVVTDASGKKVLTKTISPKTGGIVSLDVSRQAPGIYSIQVIGKETIETTKFIKN